jgi:hypothetical protein
MRQLLSNSKGDLRNMQPFLIGIGFMLLQLPPGSMPNMGRFLALAFGDRGDEARNGRCKRE